MIFIIICVIILYMKTLFSIIYSTPNVPQKFKISVFEQFENLPRLYRDILSEYIHKNPERFHRWMQAVYSRNLNIRDINALLEEIEL